MISANNVNIFSYIEDKLILKYSYQELQYIKTILKNNIYLNYEEDKIELVNNLKKIIKTYIEEKIIILCFQKIFDINSVYNLYNAYIYYIDCILFIDEIDFMKVDIQHQKNILNNNINIKKIVLKSNLSLDNIKLIKDYDLKIQVNNLDYLIDVQEEITEISDNIILNIGENINNNHVNIIKNICQTIKLHSPSLAIASSYVYRIQNNEIQKILLIREAPVYVLDKELNIAPIHILELESNYYYLYDDNLYFI